MILTCSKITEQGKGKGSEGGEEGDKDKKTSKERKKLAIRAKVPWDFWSDVYAGVIQPLHSDQLRITIEIEAEGEIDENTINQKIRETLNQIGAEVERFDVNDADEDKG